MKYSKQRELVEQTVQSCRTHPRAEEVYAWLKPDNPNLSLGTVYRNLGALAREGSIRRLSFADGSDRFDGITTDHHHVVCTTCGAVFDFSFHETEEVLLQAQKQTAIPITSCTIVAHGVCLNCR